MREIWMMANYEWKLIRSKRLLLLFAIFYAVLCIAIAYFGSFYAGYGRIQNLRTTGISLMNFSLLFLPLMALLSGVTSFTDQKESWELICTQPITIGELMIGKFLGQFFGMILPILAGFVMSAIVIVSSGTFYGWRDYLFLLLLNIVTAAVFLAISFAVAALCKRGAKVFGWIFAVWATMVLFYDMLVIGLVILSTGLNQQISLWAALLFNPVDMIRILGVSQMGVYDAVSATGTLVQETLQTKGPAFLLVAVFIWFAGCLFAAIQFTRRQDLV
ncbi:ABC transporter permease [Fodinisporobacter ferrooxydans]|uniref:ABC transporter permease n=1 Tax=Fodinisporobacter ferrooxydans TaxID=2901836 RepID=A0ABY4CNT4_9BACL|nr:ABC transporter permease [Alicyclobacillaceae bacterium MYW30-H2]